MKTADRILVDGLQAPFSRGKHRSMAEDWVETAAQIKRELASCPVLVADNVAAYTRTREANYVLEEFPCLAPPWPVFFLEYPSMSGKQRRAVIVRDVTDQQAGATVDNAFEGSIKDARANGFEGEPKWVVEMAVMAEDAKHTVVGPVGWLVLALDERGMVVGNRWVLGTPRGPFVMQEFRLYNGDTFDDTWLIAALLPAFQAISFLHCKNMVVDQVDPPAKLSAKHRRNHGRPLLRYQQVRLEVPRAGTRPRGSGGGEMGPPSLHIVAGHMAHYGDCHAPRPGCPQKHGYDRCGGCGGHDPHGKLFGKHQGMYWVPQMSRGDPVRGEVRTDYELTVTE